MVVDELLTELGYSDSPNFLRADRTGDFSQTIDYGPILRRAAERCQLQGVYALHQGRKGAHETVVPLVYVCEAKKDDDAERIHRSVWNQNIAPFLIVVSPKAIRLYSGFRYERAADEAKKTPEQGLLRAAETIDQAMTFLGSFRSGKIDDGSVWDEWGKEITPETRVDWSLLTKLNDLDDWLQSNGLTSEVSHSLIGKYVYLYYLRHRDILSDQRLSIWGLAPDEIFSRDASLKAFWSVVEKLDGWLNGSAFVLERSKHSGLTESQLQKVAGTFRGDDPGTGQLVLAFGNCDFSLIPIETLSVIYEQFLHSPTTQGSSTGKQSGAFYTPIPLVNFMLEELDSLHPFHKGMKVLDPSCGSGAFLVQCYRRIVEQDEEFVPGHTMRLAHLRDLLESHIFGIDRDGDACRVAELSLSLTLLDYVDLSDLESPERFQLPDLHGTNIFKGDFFDKEAKWSRVLGESKFDWIVGNPPWIELKSGQIADRDRPVWGWMQDVENQQKFPTGGNQVAEAFAWEVTNYLADGGYAGLLLPAMTLFKDESAAFRKALFGNLTVSSVANFSNLAEVLFPGHKRRIKGKSKTFRARRPAAGFFYTRKANSEQDRPIWVFSPLVADQPANRPAGHRPRKRQNVWNIVVAANQVQAVDVAEAATGSLLPWKLAMWGSHLDSRLIATVSRRFDDLTKFCSLHHLENGEGFALRTRSDLRLMISLNDVRGIPTSGTNLFVVANVKSVLCFRVFDTKGKVVVDTDEKRLTTQSQPITVLKRQLDNLWPPHELISSEKQQVISAVSSIVNHKYDAVEELPELTGYYEFKTSEVAKAGMVFDFPSGSLTKLPPERCYVRKRSGVKVPLKVSKPPHIIVDKLRRFAVYSEKPIVVPARQIGIAGDDSQKALLKALSLYLVSDFAIYHQFLHSSEWDVSTSISTLKTLRRLPVPLGRLSHEELSDWSSLHAEIVRAAHYAPDALAASRSQDTRTLDDLLSEMNGRVYELLRLRPDQRALVSDLVNVRMMLIQGKTPKDATRPPTESELRDYARQLRDELDAFTEDQPLLRHRILVGKCAHHGIVSIALDQTSSGRIPVEIVDIKQARDSSFVPAQDRIRRGHNQWVYFERDVRLYEGTTTYLLKPFERLHWTVTKAQLDASTIISETLSG
jgi:N-6 DNA Methylase